MSARCKCGRRRFTTLDLRRWNTEIGEYVNNGGDRREFNPEWTRAMCWTVIGLPCNMKPIAPTKRSRRTRD